MIICSPENRKFPLVNRNVKPKERKYIAEMYQPQISEPSERALPKHGVCIGNISFHKALWTVFVES